MTTDSVWAQASPTGVAGYATTTDANSTYGCWVTVDQEMASDLVWFYSPSGASALPPWVGIFSATSSSAGTLLASNSSPTWSGAAGSGWVSTPLSGVLLATGTVYVVCVGVGATSVEHAYIFSGSSWFGTTGPGGIITAPATEFAVHNGPYFNGASATYPNTTNSSNLNWLVDLEVQTPVISANVTGVAAVVTLATPGTGFATGTGGPWRLFPSTSGPSSAVTYTGDFLPGVSFAVYGGGVWFEGYWWWVCSTGQPTSPVECALWYNTGTDAGKLVPGSAVTSGTLTAGQWNWIPLAQPLQLAPTFSPGNSAYSGSYTAVVAANGSYPQTAGYFTTAGPGAGGITSGPLTAFSDASGTLPGPYSQAQGVSSAAGSDPSAVLPTTGSGSSNYWVDVQVSTIPPAAWTGTYRLWPNMMGTPNEVTVSDSAVAYNIGTEIDVIVAVTLNYMHYFVPAAMESAAGLATAVTIWNIATGASVAGVTSPSWTLEDGTPATTSNAPGQWVKVALPADTVLQPGDYRVTVYDSAGALGFWGSKDASSEYWQDGTNTGAGGSGITWGPLRAPSQAQANAGTFYPGSGTGQTGAQPVFAYDGSNDFPVYTTGLNPAQNYWVDFEVTVSNANVTGTAAVVTLAGGAGTPAGTASANVAATGAQVTAAGGAGTPAGTTPANVTGAGATVTVAGGAGTPSGSSPSANVTGVAASVVVTAGTGTITHTNGGGMTLATLTPTSLAIGGGSPSDLTTILTGSPLGSNTGILFSNNLRSFVVVQATAATTVTSDIGTTIQGQAVPGVSGNISAAGIYFFGPYPSQYDRQDGTADIEVDFGTPGSVSGVAVITIPGVS